MAPAFFAVILPMHVAMWLLTPPYTLVAWAVIVALAWQMARRRYHADERLANWRADRQARHAASHSAWR